MLTYLSERDTLHLSFAKRRSGDKKVTDLGCEDLFSFVLISHDLTMPSALWNGLR